MENKPGILISGGSEHIVRLPRGAVTVSEFKILEELKTFIAKNKEEAKKAESV